MCFIWDHYSPEMCASDPKYFFFKLLVRICFALPHILPPPLVSVFYKQGEQVGREGRGEKR